VSDPSGPQRLVGRIFAWLRDLAALGAVGIFLAGAAARGAGAVRDAKILALRYATPWPVLAALALFAGVVWWKRRRRVAAIALTAVVVCAGLWWSGSRRSHPPAHAPGEVRLAYWNSARSPERAGLTTEYAAQLGADVLALGETGSGRGKTPRAWYERFADRSIVAMPGGMLLITRGRARLLESGLLGGSGNYGVAAVELDGAAWTFIVCDLFAQPWYPRQPAFDYIGKLIAQYRGPRLVVMGDFNTPGDAPATAVLRGSMRDAFETAGHGWAETWPVPVPLLSLDHIWLSPDLRVLRCEHGWSGLSDHRPVIATVAP
jgi:vancomycin resistance protein VanJ